MMRLSIRVQFIIGFVLVLLMVSTRGHHFATLALLPGASWAVFFLAGVYLRSQWVLPGLLALTWLLDFAAFTWGNTSGFCLTRAYVFLLPAYSALWFGGRWYARNYHFEWRSLITLSVGVLVSATVCELFSSGSFYFFSGRFDDPALIEFGSRLLKYFPSYLQSLFFYIGIASVVHIVLVHGMPDQRKTMVG